MNTEPDEMSYKGIAPISHGGGECYPNPNLNVLTFVWQLLHWNLFETVIHTCCVVLCCA